MPLTDFQVKNATPGKKPPALRKGDPSKGTKEAQKQNGQKINKNSASADSATTPQEQTGSYKLYDGEGLSI